MNIGWGEVGNKVGNNQLRATSRRRRRWRCRLRLRLLFSRPGSAESLIAYRSEDRERGRVKWVEWVSVARPSLYPALENRKNGEDEWMSKWVSECERKRGREKRESCTWLRLCCPLSPPQRRPMTGGGSEGVNKRPQAPQGVRGPSVNPSISQSISTIITLEQKTPALSSLSSHPASKTTLSDAPWLSPSKNRKLLCHTHTYTPYTFPSP